MFLAAARALSDAAPSRHDREALLYPDVEHVRPTARAVAIAVAMEAARTGVGQPLDAQTLELRVDALGWEPRYRPLMRRDG
jgi:malic enzyme